MTVDAPLDALGDVAVVTRREPPTQTELVELVALEMVLEAEHVAEVVRGDLDRRLADLERGFGRRAVPLLGDEDAGLGAYLLQLQSECQPGEAAAENRDVIAFGGLLILAHASLLSLGETVSI